ncbi:mucin-17 [Anopheles bellator]|uniref:mucin-17 n=1 Tax=Anopheles bellator TaxID=139047 RepID=UPI0026470E9C|nr:mucin-17 [Anopheles bellator]
MRQRRRSKDTCTMTMSLTAMVLAMALALLPAEAEAGERWSRQLTEFSGVVTGPGNDWVPLSRPIDRQSGARVLNYFTAPAGLQQGGSFLGPDNVAQAQQHHFTFLNHQFPQSNRFVLQPQPQQPELQPFHHLSSQPTFHHQRPGPAFVGQTIQHPPPPPPPSVQSSANPFEQQFFPKSEALPLTQDDKPSAAAADQPFSYQHIRQPPELEPTGPRQPAPVSQEEVQLLYVPVETLFNQKPVPEPSSPASSSIDSGARFNALPHPVSPSLINDFYTASTATTATVQQSQRTTAPTPATKPKPNQPPLALFLYNDGRQSKLSTGDALGGLKNVNEIAVLDAVGKNSPKVFIGPAGLTPPKSYSRFDLPYLSSVDGLAAAGRANRKIEDHPFYVAPLSHKTPAGYSKIALPAPHVGSVIVRQQAAGNALAPDQTPFYTRPTPAQSHVQYYTPSTLNFGDPAVTTKQDADHYSSPTGRPTTTQSVATQSSPDGRSVSQYNSFSAAVPTRHHHSTAAAVNEEYFNLAKTKKPVPTTTGPFRSGTGVTRQFDFKPMPEQRIPTAYEPNGEYLTTPITTTPVTTTFLTTTTEKPTTIEQRLQQLEADRMRTHFREENFRSRHRPQYQHQPATVSTERTYEDVPAKQTHFVHKFKLVDSVRPSAQTKSIVDNAFLEFFSPRPATPVEDDQMVRTTVTAFLPSSASGHERQAIRNNYYNSIGSGLDEQTGTGPRQKFVNTYYTSAEPGSRSTTAGTVTPPTVATSTTLSTQDAFFREFEQKSKFFEREPKYRTHFGGQELGSTSAGAYINKYRYETDFTDSPPRYSVKVITTGEPTTTVEPAPATEQYSVPSELPPISANLPGLVNALMDDQWAGRPANGQTTSRDVTRVPHSRKHRPTTTPGDSYDDTPVTTTRRPLQRGRRPHPSRTTPAPDAAGDFPSSTRAPSQRSRSRYVPNNDERPIGRTRSRSRPNTPRPAAPKQDLDYQRDVLKQNYPVIRPQSLANGESSAGEPVATTPTTTTTTTVAPPTTTPSSTTLIYRDAYEDQTDRLIATTLINEVPLGPEQHEVTRKYSTYFSEEPYEPEVTATTATPPQTTNYFRPASTEPEAEYPSRSREVIPLDHSVIPLRSTEAPRQTSSFYTEADSDERNYSREPMEDGVMELKKVETPVRPGRRPNLLARQPYAGRSTTERTTTVRTTTSPAETVRSSGRRPAFVRRPSRLYATSTVAPPVPTTTSPSAEGAEQPTQGSYSLRTKNRQDILRGRTRQRPTTTTAAPEPNDSPATAASPDTAATRGFGRTGSLRRTAGNLRSRQEATAPPTTQQPPATAGNGGPRFRIRERTRFTLQPQESQWSTKLNQNSFQPVLKPATHTSDEPEDETEDVSHEPETEIVTAVSPDSEMYFVNVTSNLNQKGSEEDSHAEDSTEHSPSFADLLNDVMKDFIKDASLAAPSKVAEKVEEATERDRTSSSFRNNFLRKRSRPRVIDSFEAAESQHINRHATQTLNGAGPHLHYPVKNIDRATLPLAKNDLQGDDNRFEAAQPDERENTAQEESTAAPTANDDTTTDEVPTLVPDLPDPSSNPTADSQTTVKPADELVPTVAGSEQASSTGAAPQAITAEAATTSGASGIFDDVKKQLSDLYKMAENDPETEEVLDREDDPLTGAEHPDDLLDVPTTEETAAAEAGVEYLGDDKSVISTGVDMAPSETEYSPVAVADPMGSLVIPTSVSNGITHETEICYRGRCIKTEDDDRTKAKEEP